MPGPKKGARRIACVAVMMGLLRGVADAGWVVDEHGDCVSEWSAGSLARGPLAILQAPLAPFRSAAGGVQLAQEDRMQGGVMRKIVMPPFLAIVGGAMGLVDAGIWLAGGLADTVTGGYFTLAPEEATHPSLAPIRPSLLGDGRKAPATDPCGRPRAGDLISSDR